jgi:hypothetical protein
MITRGEVELHVECFSEGTEKRQYELRSTIGGNMQWDSVRGEDVKDEQFR